MQRTVKDVGVYLHGIQQLKQVIPPPVVRERIPFINEKDSWLGQYFSETT